VKKQILLIVIFTLLSVAADQATKYWARGALRGQPTMTVVKGYLDLEYHENPGSAFGLLRNVPGARYILIGVGVVALVLVWTMVRKVDRGKTVASIAFALVAGGAIGNLIDRIYLGRVVDFIVMHWQRKYVWPAYNVADAVLVIGVGLLVLVLGRRPEGAVGKAKAKPRRAAR